MTALRQSEDCERGQTQGEDVLRPTEEDALTEEVLRLKERCQEVVRNGADLEQARDRAEAKACELEAALARTLARREADVSSLQADCQRLQVAVPGPEHEPRLDKIDKVHEASQRRVQLRECCHTNVIAVAFFKLWCGAFAWQVVAFAFDAAVFTDDDGGHSFYTDQYHSKAGLYFSRAIVVGFFDASLCTFGAYIFQIIFVQRCRVRLDSSADKLDLVHLWLSALAVGMGWQYLTAIATAIYMSLVGRGFVFPNDPTYAPGEVVINFIVYAVCQSGIFRFVSKHVCEARWASGLIDVQVGFAGFGFYLAGVVSVPSENWVLIALVAATWTSALALCPLLPGHLKLLFCDRKGRDGGGGEVSEDSEVSQDSERPGL